MYTCQAKREKVVSPPQNCPQRYTKVIPIAGHRSVRAERLVVRRRNNAFVLGRGLEIIRILTSSKQFKLLLNFTIMLDQRIGKDEWWQTANKCMDALGVVCECGFFFSSTWLSHDSWDHLQPFHTPRCAPHHV